MATATINNKLGCVVVTSGLAISIVRSGITYPLKQITFTRDEKYSFTRAVTGKNVIMYDYSASAGQNHSYKIIGVYMNDEESDVESVSINYILNDAFLTDKDRSLRIQYDPDVTSFKIITDDSITKTLGSRYPFARRNGDTYYRQFNIGGLISYEGEGGAFEQHDTEPKPLFVDMPPSISESDNYNKMILTERAYRDLVLDFLHDGKIKLFKSNTEGLIPVRLTNISLTPNKTLGRNIWSFSAQATEMAMPTESFVYGGSI